MKAYIVETPNGPFQQIEVTTPEPSPDQVLVKISASSVNPLDTKIRAGQGGHAKQPLPAILGLDMAGIVAAVGANVTVFKPGDEVYGMVGGVAATFDARSLFALNPSSNHIKENLMIDTPNIPLTSHRFVEADGVKVFYREAGPAENPSLVRHICLPF